MMNKNKKFSILLVEDHPLIRKISIAILENLNYRVTAASTGQMALDFSNQQRFDLILMDIGLPDIDGLCVIFRIRNHSKWNRTSSIVALTAHLDREYIRQSFEMGANDFLIKPINFDIAERFPEKFSPVSEE